MFLYSKLISETQHAARLLLSSMVGVLDAWEEVATGVFKLNILLDFQSHVSSSLSVFSLFSLSLVSSCNLLEIMVTAF